jgi:hypothetical protein
MIGGAKGKKGGGIRMRRKRGYFAVLKRPPEAGGITGSRNSGKKTQTYRGLYNK